MGVIHEPVQQRLERLSELARRTGGPAELEGLLDTFIGAFEDYAGGHAPSPGRLTDEQAQGLTEIGVNVEVIREVTDPGAELAARETAVTSSALTASEAAKRLSVSPTRVRQRLTSDPPTLIGRRVAGGEWRLPAFQFDQRNVVAEWGSEVIAALPAGMSLGYLQALFTRPNDVLRDENGRPLSPIDWLAAGHDPTPLVELARNADIVA
jgi:hypothetical protein